MFKRKEYTPHELFGPTKQEIREIKKEIKWKKRWKNLEQVLDKQEKELLIVKSKIESQIKKHEELLERMDK